MIEIEKSADDIDRASRLTEAENEYRISVVLAAAKPLQVQNPDGTWPVTECACGEEIPIERRKIGRINCVYCQSEIERKRNGR